MELVSEWFVPPRALETAWFGPDNVLEVMVAQAAEARAIPEMIGPRGPKASISTDLVAHYILAKS